MIALLLAVVALAPVGVVDRGIFPDLAPRVTLGPVPWLPPEAPRLEVDAEHRLATLFYGALPVDLVPIRHAADTPDGLGLRPADAARLAAIPALRVVRRAAPRARDQDRDGIDDRLDVRLGARKVALNGARYRGTYERLAWPGGDVDRTYGVCTDVVIRAVRNAGIDLQVRLWRDMKRHPHRYRLKAGARPNRHIDHRRVRRLLPYFEARYRALPTRFDATARGSAAWLPGDIVFLDTLPKAGADHIGLVSDRMGPDGQPMIINNWTDGYSTRDMALLDAIPVLARFRIGLRR